MLRLTLLSLAVSAALAPARAEKAPRFELRDGDRVVLIGSTVIEREQRTGYWETALTSAFPDRNVTFRNLGWSGDTVWGEARAAFDTPREGYQRLVEHTLTAKPTVLFVGYGTNESFAGDAGLPKFVAQFNKLLDDLARSKARVVLLAPVAFEQATWPAGQFEQRQRDLKRYTEAIREVAARRGAVFADEPVQRAAASAALTDNGVHLTPYGYWRTATPLLEALHLPRPVLKPVELDGLSAKRVVQDRLPRPPVPPDGAKLGVQADSLVASPLKGGGLKPGKYTLQIDGRPVHTADAQAWLQPADSAMLIARGPSLDQAEKLRQTIVQKNRLYFYRWRPQNETYLFGFRKYEQGQNAREIPQFDPLIAQLEKEIARLRKPVPHTYQLVPARDEKQ